VIAQQILSAVARTGQRFGSSYVIDVLRGSKNEKVLQRGHDSLPLFGLCAAVPAMRLGNYIDQLVDDGVLVRSDGEYPILQLGGTAAEVLRGERDLQLLAPKAGIEARPQRRRRAGTSAASETRELDGGEQTLFDAMRTLRRQLATELAVPPYVVFSDATLEELARTRPKSANAMLGVRGIGQKKLETFGERFLALIAEHAVQRATEAQ
jgi:ATP-dependent DNA helicase RecQ